MRDKKEEEELEEEAGGWEMLGMYEEVTLKCPQSSLAYHSYWFMAAVLWQKVVL